MATQTEQQRDDAAMRVRIEEALATPDAFRSWLDGKSDGALIGRAGVCDNCPLWLFLTETCGAGFGIQVGDEDVRTLHGRCLSLPAWAHHVVRGIDALGEDCPVTVAIARRILDEEVLP